MLQLVYHQAWPESSECSPNCLWKFQSWRHPGSQPVPVWKMTPSEKQRSAMQNVSLLCENTQLIFTDKSCMGHDFWSIWYKIFKQSIFPLMRRNIIVHFCMQSATSTQFKEIWNNAFDRSVGILHFYLDQLTFSRLLALLLDIRYFTSLQLWTVDRAPLPLLHKGLERVAQQWDTKSWPLLPDFLKCYSLSYFDLIEK